MILLKSSIDKTIFSLATLSNLGIAILVAGFTFNKL